MRLLTWASIENPDEGDSQSDDVLAVLQPSWRYLQGVWRAAVGLHDLVAVGQAFDLRLSGYARHWAGPAPVRWLCRDVQRAPEFPALPQDHAVPGQPGVHLTDAQYRALVTGFAVPEVQVDADVCLYAGAKLKSLRDLRIYWRAELPNLPGVWETRSFPLGECLDRVQEEVR